MADIARIANVSRTTVSLVLNDRHVDGVGISDETRKRVKEAAARLGYRVNHLARSVATGRSRFVGVVGLDRADNSALSVPALIAGAVHHADARDCSIKMLPASAGAGELADRCLSYRMRGVLLRTRDRALAGGLADALAKHGIPLVLVDSPFDDPPAPSVVADDGDGMRQAVEYLASLGHRRLTYIAFEDFQPFTKRRRAGFEETVARLGGRVESALVNTDAGPSNPELFARAGRPPPLEGVCRHTDDGRPLPAFERAQLILGELLDAGERPDAFVCNCDELAMNVLGVLWARGLRVPDDVSVTGFGNHLVDDLASPPLTSVAVPYDRLTEMALDLLLTGSREPRELRLPVSIQIRRSTRPKRSALEGYASPPGRRFRP